MSGNMDVQAYVNYMMERLPNVEKGETYKLKKGDNLWEMAKRELNNPKATNQEISEYMLLIAKLNNLETVDKMNNLKVNDEIYLPEKIMKNTASEISQPKEQTDAQKSFKQIKNTLLSDKSVRITQAYPKFLNLYHVYNNYKDEKTGYTSCFHPVISFNLDNNGKFTKGSFEGEEDIYSFGYDYNVNRKGDVTPNGRWAPSVECQIPAQDMQAVIERLEDLTQTATISYQF